MMGMGMGYWIIGIGAMLVSKLVQWRFKAALKELDQIAISSNLTGREIALKMLNDYGIDDVEVISVGGRLTDHYNPGNRTVNLSEAVYDRRSITAAAVAAHECGHAVQHAKHYPMLKLRSSLVPMVNLGSRFSPILLMVGLGMMSAVSQMGTIGMWIFVAGMIGMGLSTLFALVTLPVEFDASNRALAWLEDTGIAHGEEYNQAKRGLKWAAMTYVVAALTQLAYLLYYVQIFMKRR